MRSKLGFLALAPLLVSAAAPPPKILRMDGIGPVRIGMTVQQAERALHARMKLDSPYQDRADWDECAYAERIDGKQPEIGYMVAHNRITRIEIGQVDGKPDSSITTEKGIGLNATRAAVRRAYGRALRETPNIYMDAKDSNLVAYGPGRKTMLLFETAEGRVTSFRVGYRADVELAEGCS